MKPSRKWMERSKEYRLHAKDFDDCCSFSDEDAEAQFMSESFSGKHFFHYTKRNSHGKYNGFAVGKHWQGVMESYYNQDVQDHNFCKAEFMNPEHTDYIHSANVFESIEATSWFPYMQRGQHDSVQTDKEQKGKATLSS